MPASVIWLEPAVTPASDGSRIEARDGDGAVTPLLLRRLSLAKRSLQACAIGGVGRCERLTAREILW
jgi:hypothetical protein